jgi:hypothetical protein
VLSKNPAKLADPAQRAGRDRRGVLSFGDLFFAQAKKSHSLATAGETKCRKPLQKIAPDPLDSRSLAALGMTSCF